MNNPASYDPSRTATLRRRFVNDTLRRFDSLRKKLIQLVEKDDAFGLGLPVQMPTLNWTRFVTNDRYQFLSSPDKLDEFRRWLATELQDVILTDPDILADDWWQKYVEEGFKQGAGRTFDDFRKTGPLLGAKLPWYVGTKEQFLRSSFANPVSKERVKLLGSRVYTELKGVTDAMAKELARELTDGMTQGKSPRDVARAMTKVIEGMSRTRASTIARTETIRAHAEGQLNSLEAMGIEEIGVAVEWSATKRLDGTFDKRVCKQCAAMDGVVLKVKDAHGLIPRHPNCRCAFIPANLGEDEQRQKRTEKEIRKAFRRSIEMEGRKGTLQEQQAASSWRGADATPKAAPKSIFNLARLLVNVFCATGPGGGVDPTCKRGGTSQPFTFDASQSGNWSFGSGVVPFREKDGMSPSPFPSNGEYFQRRKPTHYNAKPDPVRLVSVKELTAWQTIVDVEKLRPITDLGSLEPIRVAKIGGRLTIQNGNHRAASAFLQGISEIPAIVTDFDKPGNSKYLKPAKTG